MKKHLTTKKIALIGLLGAMSSIVRLFAFPIPFMPPFMDFDLSGMVDMIGGFVLGPVAAFFIILIKILIKLVVEGTSTALTGEVQNFILSCAFVLPAAFFYKHKKSKHSAIIGMIIGSVACSLIAIVTNLTLIIPFYVKLFGMSMESIIEMCNAVNPYITNTISFAILGIIPFNIIKSAAASVVTLALYKKLSKPIKQMLA